MEYQVWTFDEYENWKKVDCPDLATAKTEIMLAMKSGKDPLLTAAVPFDFDVKVKEAQIGEAIKVKAKSDKGAGGESDSALHAGNEGAAEKQPGGSRSNRTGSGAKD